MTESDMQQFAVGAHPTPLLRLVRIRSICSAAPLLRAHFGAGDSSAIHASTLRSSTGNGTAP